MELSHHPKTTNWTLVIIVLITVFGFIAYNYIQTINTQNDIAKQKIESDAQIARDKLNQEEQSTIDIQNRADEKEKSATIDLSICLKDAEVEYSLNWDTSCASQSKQRETSYFRCIDFCNQSNNSCGDETDNAKYCRNIHPKLPILNCTLPSSTALRWDDLKSSNEQHCYDLYSK